MIEDICNQCGETISRDHVYTVDKATKMLVDSGFDPDTQEELCYSCYILHHQQHGALLSRQSSRISETERDRRSH